MSETAELSRFITALLVVVAASVVAAGLLGLHRLSINVTENLKVIRQNSTIISLTEAISLTDAHKLVEDYPGDYVKFDAIATEAVPLDDDQFYRYVLWTSGRDVTAWKGTITYTNSETDVYCLEYKNVANSRAPHMHINADGNISESNC